MIRTGRSRAAAPHAQRRAERVTLAFVVACALAMALAAPAGAKSYTMGPVDIQAQVHPDGSMAVIEDRAFDFSGDYTFVYWDLAKKGSTGLTVKGVDEVSGGSATPYTRTTDPNAKDTRPPSSYWVDDNGSDVFVYAFFRKSDESATFRLTYDVAGAAQRYTDASELYWQFVGSGWGAPTTDLSITIKPPTTLTKDQVQAWAHGPLTGVVTIQDDGTVVLKAPDVPENTFVEARVLYPADALATAPVINQPVRQSVLDEEGKLANEANATRKAAQAQVAREEEIRRVVVPLAIGAEALLALLALAFAIWAFLVHGREYKPTFEGEYFREDPRPDLHPAVVGALWRFGQVADADAAATLMNLADTGAITMQPVTETKQGLFGGHDEQTYELALNPQRTENLAGLDATLTDILFNRIGSQGRVRLDDIKAYAKSNPKTFSEEMQGWKDDASLEADKDGLIEPEGQAWQVGTVVLAVAVGGSGILAAWLTGSATPAVFPILVAAIIFVISRYMTRRSRAGAELFAQYRGVRNYLRDFSRLNEAPPASVVLWNRFLVLAVVFGIAEEVIEQLRVKVPEVVQDPNFATTYWWVYAGSYGGSPVSALSSGFASAAQVASSAMSSASGMGGGFSGGGGFGGGGGGGGAG